MNNNSVVNVDLRKYALVENKEWVESDVNGETVQIPMHWSTGPLTDLILLKNGSAFKPEDWARTGRPIIRIQNLTNPSAEVNRFNGDKPGLVSITKDDYLFAWSGTIDVFKYKGEPAYLNQHIFKVTAKMEHNLDYSIFCLRYHLPKIPTNGLGMAHITTAELNRFTSIYTPSPSEQTAIAAVLSTQESIISDISLLISKHEQRLAWLSDQLLSGKLRVRINGVSTGTVADIGDTLALENFSFYQNPDENWKEANVNDDAVQIPLDWDVSPFEKFGKFVTGKDYKGNIGDMYPVYGSSKNALTTKSSKALYTKPSFLIGRKGTIDKPFKINDPFWCVDTAMYFDFNDSCQRDFVFYATYQIDWLRYSEGAVVPSLVQSKTNKIQIMHPGSMTEQIAIASVLSAQEALISDYKKLLEKEKQRMEWLSDALLSGKYRLQAIES